MSNNRTASYVLLEVIGSLRDSVKSFLTAIAQD